MTNAWTLVIDFGTSNTAAAAIGSAGRAEPLQLDGGGSMPSAVLKTDDGFIVGKPAINRRRMTPSRFEAEPKRAVGEGRLQLGDDVVPVSELIAAIVRHVIADAARDHAGAPSSVLLTHPHDWTSGQRQVLLDGAVTAGLAKGTLNLVSEPIAAIHFYAADSELPDNEVFAVLDLGGGTCDIAVLRRSGTVYTVLGAGGDNNLGGRNFDNQLYDWTLAKLAERGDAALVERLREPANLKDVLTLRNAVTSAKEELSLEASSDIPIVIGDADTIVVITRDEYQELIAGDVERIAALTTRVLVDTGVSPADVRDTFMTGGASRTPAVLDRITTLMGKPVAKLHDPKLVVALGALSTPPAEYTGVAPAVSKKAKPVTEKAVVDPEAERIAREKRELQRRERERKAQEKREAEEAAARLAAQVRTQTTTFSAARIVGIIAVFLIGVPLVFSLIFAFPVIGVPAAGGLGYLISRLFKK